MTRLRHFAVVVRDLEKSAKFYEDVFGLKRVGQEKLDFAAAVFKQLEKRFGHYAFPSTMASSAIRT